MTGGGFAWGRASIPLLLALVALLGLWRGLMGGGVTGAIEDRLLDLRFQIRGPVPAPTEIVIVEIDEDTIDRLGWSPPPRWALAEGIRAIAGAGAKVIAVDLLLVDQTAAGPDLAAALSEGGGVVLAAALTNTEGARSGPLPVEAQAAVEQSVIPLVVRERAMDPGTAPARLLLPHAGMIGGASLAHVNVTSAPDGVVRRVPLSLWIGGDEYLPSIALEIARRLRGVDRNDLVLWPGRGVQLGGETIATDRSGSVTLNHYGGAGAIASVSLLDVLDGKVPAEVFAGRAVFLGATAESLSDLFATPFSAAVPGVEVLATLAGNLLGGRQIRARQTAQFWATLALALVLAILIALTARQRSTFACYAGTGAAWLTGAFSLQIAFSGLDIQLDAVTVLGALLLATVWTSIQRFRSERGLSIRASRERANLARYVPPALAQRLASGAIGEIDRRTQEATILFADVAGYTALAEDLHPEEVAAFLRGLHEFFDRCATAGHGVIANFEGDGAMIVFGLPEPAPGDAAAALACATMLLEEAHTIGLPDGSDRAVSLRAGIHSGLVAVAVLGSTRQAQITVTGDTVNVASRFLEIAKTHGTQAVASRVTLDSARAAGSQIATRFSPLAQTAVRGRSGPVEIWRL